MKTRHFMGVILAGTMLFTIGCGTETNTTKPSNGQTTPTPTQPAKVDVPAQDQVEVAIYRSDAQAMQVVKEMLPLVKMDSDEKRALAIFQLLKSVPKDVNTSTAVPQAVELNGATFNDGVLTLDFNNKVHQLHGSATENMFVDAVTMTMFDNFPQVSQIQFYSNGEPAIVLTNMSVKNGFVRPSNGRAMTSPKSLAS